jgi:hypothetical protein
MSTEQRIRAGLFYISVIVFFTWLPVILSFALGYKFNPKSLKFTKTGLIVIKTQPSGAAVYLDNRLLSEKTPATIDELLPGRYNIKIKLEKYYPWAGDVDIAAGSVSRLDRVMLFPRRPNIKQVNKLQFSQFWLGHDAREIYYLSRDGKSIYRSNLEGEQLEKIGDYLEITPRPKKWLLSEDKEKLLYFNQHQIAVVYLKKAFQDGNSEASFVLTYPERFIHDVFWHSDSYHLVLVSSDSIEVLEAKPRGVSVNLVSLSKENPFAFYDAKTDTLYFIDTARASDGNLYDNLYTLTLNNKLFGFGELMKLAPSFETARQKNSDKDNEKK